MHDAVRNLRTAERFLLTPPLAAAFGATAVAVCDISAKGARFRHDAPIENGTKAVLRVVADGSASPASLEAVVVWTQPDPTMPGKFMSGARTYGAPEVMQSLLVQLQASQRTRRVEELRSTDRFYLSPSIAGDFDGQVAQIENLSARGARVELQIEPLRGSVATLRFPVPDSQLEVSVQGQVMWTAVKAI
ncbi:MAG TPA: PilZ domain-containing protein, partial [Thermoanaerobaculia bacterium]